MMKNTQTRIGAILAGGLFALGVVPARGAAILVTDQSGQIWRYDSVTDMAAQTNTTTSGTLVATIAAYGSDLGATMDLSTGSVYRITGGGDVVQYTSLAGYLSNAGSLVLASGVYTGNYALNGFSYDGATGGFYGTLPNGQAPPEDNGDVRTWATIADVLNNNGVDIAASYGGNLFNFYDPDATTVQAVFTNGPYTAGDDFPGRYYQSAGNGRLEGFESIALYAASANNRSEETGLNVFGGTSTAFGGNIDAVSAFAIPEPSAALLAGIGLLALSRRRR